MCARSICPSLLEHVTTTSCSVFALQRLRIRKVKQISKRSKGVSEETSPHEEGDLEPAASLLIGGDSELGLSCLRAERTGPGVCGASLGE